MSHILDGEAWAFAKNYPGTGVWEDESGNGHDGTLTNVLTHPFGDEKHIRCPNVAANTLTTPDATAWDICDDGDLDVRVLARMVDWTPAAIMYFVSKNPAGGATGWGVYVTAAGKQTVEIGNGANRTAVCSAATGVTDGGRSWLGFTYDSSAGLANFYTWPVVVGEPRPADITDWNLCGTADRTMSGGATTCNNNANDVELGSSGGGERLNGAIFDLEVRDGINGTLIGDFDADDWPVPSDVIAATYTDGESKTYTLNQAGAAELIRLVDRPHFWFDTNAKVSIPDDPALDFALADDFTIGVGLRAYDTTTNRFLAKRNAGGVNEGYMLYLAGTGIACFIKDTAGNTTSDETAAITSGAAITAIAVRNRGDDDLEVFSSGVGTGSPTTDTATATLANNGALTIGEALGNFFQGEIWSYVILREALSDSEVAALHSQLLNQAHPSLGASEGWGTVRMGA